ncbi:ANTAR domain-containing protein [Streptomyces sp. NPDC054775]
MPSMQRWTPADQASGDKISRLSEENAQLRQAVDSHAVIDQAIGILAAVWRVPPADGWDVLREVSQHLNRKLHAVAQDVVEWALGCPLPEPVERELQALITRWERSGRQTQCPGGMDAAGESSCHQGDGGPGD